MESEVRLDPEFSPNLDPELYVINFVKYLLKSIFFITIFSSNLCLKAYTFCLYFIQYLHVVMSFCRCGGSFVDVVAHW